MALDVDGFAVLGAIATKPEAFPDIRAEAAKAARALILKQLKAKTLPLAGLRRVRDSLGAEPFALVVDGLTDADSKTLVARFDKHHPDLKVAASDWPRRRLLALASGEEPSARTAAVRAAPKPSPSKTPKITRALGSPAFVASWDGRDYDPKPGKGKDKGTKKG